MYLEIYQRSYHLGQENVSKWFMYTTKWNINSDRQEI